MTDTEIVFLLPEHVEELRNACYSDRFQKWTRQRNDALVQTLYDTGLRNVEATRLEVDMFNRTDGELWIPKRIQKKFSQGEPIPTNLGLMDDTTRTLSSYLDTREKGGDYLFPSRVSDQLSTEAVRQTVRKVAQAADVRPRKLDHERGWVDGDTDDVTPHTFRHSVAYRMLRVEDDHDIYDVKNRLRHRRLETTTNRYSHFERA